MTNTWREEFRKKFVKVTNPSTIGSSRTEMVSKMEILSVRKPDKIESFIAQQIAEAEQRGGEEEKTKLSGWIEHDSQCIRKQLERGEPTENGGYKQMYAGEWYEAKPEDKTPKCDCGLDEALKTARGTSEKEI